jgi:hypothetical protein
MFIAAARERPSALHSPIHVARFADQSLHRPDHGADFSNLRPQLHGCTIAPANATRVDESQSAVGTGAFQPDIPPQKENGHSN